MPRRNEAAKLIPFTTCRHQAPLSTITMSELYDNIYKASAIDELPTIKRYSPNPFTKNRDYTLILYLLGRAT